MMDMVLWNLKTRTVCVPLADLFGPPQLRHIQRMLNHENKVIMGDHADEEGL